MTARTPRACPCGGAAYAHCCGPLHSGAPATTAEALMRSRYSAFALGDTAHLLRTWHPDTRPARIDPDPHTTWTGLTIHATTGGTPFHTEATVDFTAAYTTAGQPGQQRENSRFRRHNGAWTYLDAHA